MRKHFLAVLAYVVATFATQAVSHFGVNAAHYATVTYLRAQPIFALGVLSMLIQGSIMSYLYAQLPSWIAVEVAAGFVQFTFYGVLLGLVHRGRDPLAAH